MNATQRRDRVVLQKERAANYAEHYERRRLFTMLPPELQEKYRQAASSVPPPAFDVYGRDCYTTGDWRIIMDAAVDFSIQVPRLINPWYVSDDGWARFQKEWQMMDDEVFV